MTADNHQRVLHQHAQKGITTLALHRVTSCTSVDVQTTVHTKLGSWITGLTHSMQEMIQILSISKALTCRERQSAKALARALYDEQLAS